MRHLNNTAIFTMLCLLLAMAVASTARAGVQLTVDGKTFDELGERIAAEIREPLKQEISKEGGTAFDVLDLGLIEGTKKPDSAVAYLGTVAKQIQIEGQSAGVIEQWFWVKTRIKVDAGGGPFTTKVAAAECQLTMKITFVPRVTNGRPSLSAEAEIVQVYGLKERHAKDSHVNKLCDQTQTKLLAEVNARLEHVNDLLPEAVRTTDKVSSIAVQRGGKVAAGGFFGGIDLAIALVVRPEGMWKELDQPASKPTRASVVVELGQPGNGFASYRE